MVWLSWFGLTFGSWLLLELLGYWHMTPWTTLSEYIWSLETSAGLLRFLLFFGLSVLAAHLATRWP